MDLSTFADISSPDEEIRKTATDVIKEAQNDPSFINFLLDLIQVPESQENSTVFQMMLIVLVDTARTHVSDFIEAMDNAEIKQALIEILFSIPLAYRPHIEECLISAAPSAPIEFSEIFQDIFEKINPNSPIEDRYTAISFSNNWIKMSLPTSFFTNFSNIILPYLQSCANEQKEDDLIINTISELASLSDTLISKGNIIFDNSLDTIFQILCTFISQPIKTEAGLKMKSNISELFLKTISFIYREWKSIEDMEEWRQNFIDTIIPEIFQNSLQACDQPMNQTLTSSLFHLFYIFLKFEINYEEIITPDFFKNVVIPTARLTNDDIKDYSLNPLQYITFCCEHENIGEFLPRICASQFFNVVLTKYNSFVEDPLSLVMPEEDPNPDDQLSLIDFEARLYLIERFTLLEEYSEMFFHSEDFETFFNMLTQEQPLYIVSALLRLIAVPMERGGNSVVGITVAEHFIINATDPIVQMMAVRLMNCCLSGFKDDKLEALSGIIELNTTELFPILLNLSSLFHLPEPMVLIQKIFKIGPQDYMNVVEELIEHFFVLWRENEAIISAQTEGDEIDDSDNNDTTNQSLMNSSLLESVTTVLESVPSDSPLIQSLSVQVLQQLGDDITDFPNSLSISDQLRVASVFSRKLSVPTEEMITFITLIIQMELYPPSIVNNFVNLICPLMFNNNEDFDFYKFDFQDYLVNFCESILQPEEEDDEGEIDAESISQALVLASCMIQSKGEEFFNLITSAIQILKNEVIKKKSIIVFGAIYVFASAFFIDAEKAQELIDEDIPDYICEVAPEFCANGAYREIKMTVFVLTSFAKFGHQKSFQVAVSLLEPLHDMKAIDESLELTSDNLIERVISHRDNMLVSLSPLIQMPFDSFDETAFLSPEEQ